MDDLPPRKKKRGLNQETLDCLLNNLAPDKESAEKEYLKIHRKMTVFFEVRGCLHAEDHADETLNRLADKYKEGATIQNPTTYCFGIAKKLFKEVLRDNKRKEEMLRNISILHSWEEDMSEPDNRLECCEICLGRLPKQSRNIMIEYYKGEKHEKIENRKRLAEREGISLNTLRIRAYRIRAELEECITECVEGKLHT